MTKHKSSRAEVILLTSSFRISFEIIKYAGSVPSGSTVIIDGVGLMGRGIWGAVCDDGPTDRDCGWAVSHLIFVFTLWRYIVALHD